MYGIFLLFAGINPVLQLLCFGLFGELVVCWTAMSYLTAIKDYKGIMLSFVAAVLVTFLLGGIFLWRGFPAEECMMTAVFLGYCVMLIWDVVLLYRYFPQSEEKAFVFLEWVDEFLSLAFTGLFVNLGLFSHLVLMWMGILKVHVQGLFYGAPYYDVPALMAFFSILITTINFVVSMEVNFYPKYRNYYSLFNDGGSIRDLKQAEHEMLEVLDNELRFTALKQVFATAIAISVGGSILNYLPLGFNDLMEGYFRTLCVGYGIYAIANTMLLILLYFTDYQGGLVASALFAGVSSIATVFSLFFSKVYFGFGFILGCTVFFLAVYIRLEQFTRRLPYYILSRQPLVEESKSGVFTRLGYFLDEKRKKEKLHEKTH